MTIRTEKEGAVCTVYLEGRLDTVTAPEAERVLDELTATETNVVLDLLRLYYVSSAGLRVFLNAHKKLRGKGTLTLRNVGAPVREVLDITGFSSILNIE